MFWSSLLLLSSSLTAARAVTVYGQIPLAQTATAGYSKPTLKAYDPIELIPPPIPQPPPAPAYTLNLERNAAAVPGLSMPHVGGSFWGFSIEMSVISQVLGKNSSFLAVPFLNLMANLQERSGGVVIRIGGNTQEFATQVPEGSLEFGHTFAKTDSGSNQTTQTPAVLYTPDMFYMANNISSMLNVKWFFGIPFNDSVNWRLTIAEQAQNILGDNLLGLQAGNEPDFYLKFGRRTTYSPQMYTDEVADLIRVMDENPNIPNKHMLIGPSVSSIEWIPEQVWETGYIERFKDRLYCLSVEHYPMNNCAALTGGGPGNPIINPQDIVDTYFKHDLPMSLMDQYRESTRLAQLAQKPFIMFETNTASCGGFPGLSDSYGAALWALDYGLQLAYGNFTHALLHVGGQDTYYNPFTSPPTNQSSFNAWSVGAVYYSALIISEVFGKTNTSQIVDIRGNFGNTYTPQYAIYERGVLSKVALFNYVNDRSGASDSLVTLNIPGGVPASVRVKYLLAPMITSRSNITWAGQTFGPQFTVDGRIRGDLNVTTISCNTAANTCIIPVPAPGFALVFLDSSAEALSLGQATETFSTSAFTQKHNTVTYEPATVSLSNGRSGSDRDKNLGTSYGYKESGDVALRVPLLSFTLSLAILSGLWIVRARALL
ncbi:Beta-glucuronidase [Psilocybe cubensis]|uniref:Beta-glucuronidase n=2 Tax=Psilocybe cubensis TaxID=181762 RepID=A0ACB8GMN0_PSICU|nr:Beta-glucuronidase [Psilocybe cubensis]KAH9476803.1 Beta-glucuronidase [Psilocybe cubensis]